MGTNEIPFKIIYAQAAGIDVGSRSHLVAVDQDKENGRAFGVYTKDHQQMISHLRAYGITTIADRIPHPRSTGILFLHLSDGCLKNL